jgi:hypothetical protein
MDHKVVNCHSLAFLAVSHALVDAVCALIIFSGQRAHLIPSYAFASLVILYNVMAFGLQPPLGLILDKWRRPRAAVIAGLLLLAASAAGLRYWPIAAVVSAGLANAVFHLGGGSISFQFSPGRAAALFFINLMTNPATNLLYRLSLHYHLLDTAWTISLLEVLVVLVEWRLMNYLSPGRSRPMFGLSLVMNAASFLVGILVFDI